MVEVYDYFMVLCKLGRGVGRGRGGRGCYGRDIDEEGYGRDMVRDVVGEYGLWIFNSSRG